MSLNPISEVKYRYRLAMEQLKRAERLYSLKDWVGVVSFSQLAAENFTKSIIAIFEVPTWSHDPSGQLESLIDRLPNELTDDLKKLAKIVRNLAPEHGRSSYREPNVGLTPSDIYREDHASDALRKAKESRKIAEKFLMP